MPRITQYSTRMPDGRLLAMKIAYEERNDPAATATFELDGEAISRQEAEKAYDAQPDYWQRGRTLQQVIDFWLGRAGAVRR